MLFFALFATVILILLWLFQIVFLQSFYEGMKTQDIERVAESLSVQYTETNFEKYAAKAAIQNSILIHITDLDGNTLYTTDEHGPRKQKGGGGGFKGMFQNYDRSLPSGYDTFLTQLLESENGRISYTIGQDDFTSKVLVYGVLLDDAALYIQTSLDPVGSTVTILRTQLVYVSVVSLLLALLIAYFIARRFAKPIAQITTQAARLAHGEFPKAFDKGFCTELDELSDTLTYASSELSKVEGLRRELIANISHDLRTPLTLVKAYTEMIRDISGDNKAKREAHLQVIASETDRLTTLVNDILALSSIQSGNETYNMENLDLSDAVKKVLAQFAPLFQHEGIELRTTVEPDQYVHADVRKIEQVLYNLLGNAMNYAGDEKKIAVRVKDLGAWTRVEVTDHGRGIPEDELPLIWERYYKAKTHQRQKAGTGLGLSIVKGILEAHGARFGVDSKEGVGSTFWFELKK